MGDQTYLPNYMSLYKLNSVIAYSVFRYRFFFHDLVHGRAIDCIEQLFKTSVDFLTEVKKWSILYRYIPFF